MRRPRIPGVGERQPPAPRVFISYRREDAAAYAGRLYDALAARFGDANVFMDVDTIALGSDFTDAIDRALASCDAAIALIGSEWTTAADGEGRRRLDDPADVLRLELERALAQGLVVIPALVRGARLPRLDELPEPLEPLVRRQGIELRDNAWRDDVGRLARQLEGLTGAVPEAGEGTSTRRRARRRWRWLAAAVAALAVLAAAAVTAVALFDGDASADGSNAQLEQGRNLTLTVFEAWQRGQLDSIDDSMLSASARRALGQMPTQPITPTPPGLDDCYDEGDGVTCSYYYPEVNIFLRIRALRYPSGFRVADVRCADPQTGEALAGGIAACARIIESS